jgi:hypothetical protein
MRKLAILGVATVLMVAYATPASAAALPAIPTYIGPPAQHDLQIEPFSLVYTGDGTGFLAGHGTAGHPRHAGHLRWTKYTSSEGLAFGSDWRDNCIPDCARGYFTPYPIKVKAFRPYVLGNHLVFTRMRITYTHGRPSRSTYRQLYTMRLQYNYQGGYSWSFG